MTASGVNHDALQLQALIGLAVPGRPIRSLVAEDRRRRDRPRPEAAVHAGYTPSRQVGESNGHERSRAVARSRRSSREPSHDLATLEEAGQSSSLPTSTTGSRSPTCSLALSKHRLSGLGPWWVRGGLGGGVLEPVGELLELVGEQVAVAVQSHRCRGMAELVTEQRRHRSHPGGFWVAGTDPAAARHALTDTAPRAGLHRAAVLSDGATRLVDRFGLLDWPGFLAVRRLLPPDLKKLAHYRDVRPDRP
jgi:hypothetical protein